MICSEYVSLIHFYFILCHAICIWTHGSRPFLKWTQEKAFCQWINGENLFYQIDDLLLGIILVFLFEVAVDRKGIVGFHGFPLMKNIGIKVKERESYPRAEFILRKLA